MRERIINAVAIAGAGVTATYMVVFALFLLAEHTSMTRGSVASKQSEYSGCSLVRWRSSRLLPRCLASSCKRRTSWFGLMSLALSVFWPGASSAYLMASQTYSNLFERADVVVIATPVSTQKSAVQLEVDQPEEIKKLVTTVSTRFKVAYVLKGQLDGTTFSYLHLNRKDRTSCS